MSVVILALIVLALALWSFHLTYKCPICGKHDTYNETERMGYCFKCERHFFEH